MKALILAAGTGTRLGAASGGLPKPLTPLGGTTPLEQNLEQVEALGIRDIWINVHHQADVIRERIGSSFRDAAIHFAYEPTLLGTAGAWKNLANEWSATTLVVYGDNFMKLDLGALQAAHKRAGTLATIAIYDPDVHANTGIGGGRVRVRDDKVVEFIEGAATGLVNAGAYCLEPGLLNRVGPGPVDFGRDIFPTLAKDGEITAHMMEKGAYCMGLDTPERLETAERMLAGRT